MTAVEKRRGVVRAMVADRSIGCALVRKDILLVVTVESSRRGGTIREAALSDGSNCLDSFESGGRREGKSLLYTLCRRTSNASIWGSAVRWSGATSRGNSNFDWLGFASRSGHVSATEIIVQQFNLRCSILPTNSKHMLWQGGIYGYLHLTNMRYARQLDRSH